MIIQCEQCSTKFKLDDSKVAEKSIKVRCARCRHVFSVAAAQGAPADLASFDQDAPVFQIGEELEVTTDEALETSVDFGSDTVLDEGSSDHSGLLDSFSFAADDEPVATDTPPPVGDDADFSLPTAESEATYNQIETHSDPDALDFGAFDFGDDSSDAGEPAVAGPAMDFDDKTMPQEQAVGSQKEESGGLDFSGDDMFGEVSSTVPEEKASDALSFDMGMDGFADSMGVEGGGAGQSGSFAAQDMTAENPFSLDDIDFGNEMTSVAVQQVSTEELKPSQDLLFAPLATAQEKPLFDDSADTLEKTPAPPVQEELPPLSIASRRKETPQVSGMLVLMGVIIAGLIVFYGTWGYMTLTEDKGTLSTQEAGRITVRSVEASYIKNKKTGDLLVISGEAVNEYSKPRAAIQIKGIVFGADGDEISSKNAFCGNPLTRDQLTTMTMEKIEAAMANQFGDSLANMEVAPGNAIPFMIVLPRPPAGAKDYGVEPAGSTLAAEK